MKIFYRRLVFLFFAMSSVAPCMADGNAPEFDFAKNGPLEFLSYLRENQAQKTFTIQEPIPGWVKTEDVPALLEFLGSEEECMSVALLSTSKIRLGSTIGDEAAFLIAGYRAKKYPAGLNSRHVEKAEQKAILDWWMSERNRVKTTKGARVQSKGPDPKHRTTGPGTTGSTTGSGTAISTTGSGTAIRHDLDYS